MISSYLKELLENNNRIIIPDFGAFMIQDSPEGKQISFNDFLKFNDGLLVNQIIKSEKISKNQASDIIKEFIKEVEKSFAKNSSFEVKGIGFLVKDNQGNIKFESKVATPQEKKVLSTDEKPTIVLDEIPNIEPKKSEPTIKEEVKIEKAAEIKSPEKPKAAVDKTEQPIKKVAPPVSPSNTVTKPNPTKTTLTPKKMKSNTTKIVLISILVVIIIGGTISAFFIFDLGEKLFRKKTVSTEMAVVDSVSTVDTLAQKEKQVVEEPVIVEEPVAISDPNAKKYYIVAGSFKRASNAERYNKKLTEEGYSSEIVMRSNGFHIVTYKMVYNRNDAKKEWSKLREINPETWIYIK
ncbi:MAG: SPOR domain-containing protein [Salinivirgaceae bacterium]